MHIFGMSNIIIVSVTPRCVLLQCTPVESLSWITCMLRIDPMIYTPFIHHIRICMHVNTSNSILSDMHFSNFFMGYLSYFMTLWLETSHSTLEEYAACGYREFLFEMLPDVLESMS